MGEEFDSDVANRLAEKLSKMDLEADERAALETILDRAAEADDEVSGYGMPVKQESMAKVKPTDLLPGAFRVGVALGLRG